jgi:tetratricopeptide (TPR) repeat protein
VLEALNHQAELNEQPWVLAAPRRAAAENKQQATQPPAASARSMRTPVPTKQTPGSGSNSSSAPSGSSRQSASSTSIPRDIAPGVPAKSTLDRYREIVELNPGDFDSHFQLCNKLMEEQLFTEAVDELQKLAKKHPKNTEVWNLMGWALLNSNQKDQAFNAWKRSLSIDPKNPETRKHLVNAHLMLGKAFRSKGIFTQALVHFKQLLSLMPRSAEVHMEIAATYDMKGDVRSAAQEYNTVLQLDPKNKVARKALNDLRMKR